MARLERLPRSEQKSLPAMACPTFSAQPWVSPPPPQERRVAIVNTAGLMNRGAERPVAPRAADYRTIADEAPDSEILMSHVSVNFDRSGFFQDINCALPRDRLRELAAAGVIGDAAGAHYSFMGANRAAQYGTACARVGRQDARGRGQHRPPGSGLTRVHARRERAGALL